MIELPEFVEFRYSEPERDRLKAVARDARLDVDQMTQRCMEAVASAYLPRSALNRQRLGHDELETLRKDAENLRERIAGALAMHFNIKSTKVPHAIPNSGGDYEMLDAKVPHIFPSAIPHPGVDRDMLDATDDYFWKLARTLDHQIKTAETKTRRDSARKTERDEFWTQLLLLWIDIGGKPNGVQTARFLIAASAPVGEDASTKTVLRWLDRQKKIISKLVEEVRSVVGPRK